MARRYKGRLDTFRTDLVYIQVSFISSRASRVFQVSRSPPRPTISLSREALRSARNKLEERSGGGGLHSVGMVPVRTEENYPTLFKIRGEYLMRAEQFCTPGDGGFSPQFIDLHIVLVMN